MAEDKSKPDRVFITDGYQAVERGYQAVVSLPKESGGHQGETGKLGKPPTGGSSSGQ